MFARIGIFTDLRGCVRTEREVCLCLVGIIDDLDRICRAGRNENNAGRLDWQHLASDAQCSAALDDDEHLVLRVVQVRGTAALAGREDVERRTELSRSSASYKASTSRVVMRIALQLLERNFVEVANEGCSKLACSIRHDRRLCSGRETIGAIRWPTRLDHRRRFIARRKVIGVRGLAPGVSGYQHD